MGRGVRGGSTGAKNDLTRRACEGHTLNVLVTGATGFIGRHVVQALLGRGFAVTAMARNRDRAREFEWYPSVSFLTYDICGRESDPVQVFGPADAVVHLAWQGLPDYQERFHVEDNLPANYQFLKSLVTAGYDRLLVAGTCLEYGMQSGCLSEETETCPTTPYGVAKDALRKSLQSLQREIPFDLQWARLFYTYGEGQNPASLLAQLDRAIDRGDTSFDMSGGEQLRDYLPVSEVAARLAWLVEHSEITGSINICSGKPISVRELVESRVAERGANIELNLGSHPYPDYEPMAFWGRSRIPNNVRMES